MSLAETIRENLANARENGHAIPESDSDVVDEMIEFGALSENVDKVAATSIVAELRAGGY